MFSAACKVLAMGQDSNDNNYGTSKTCQTTVSEIGGRTLAELRDFHNRELEEEYIALWDTGGIDWVYGGFIPRWDENGNFTTDEKQMYYMGRGLWVFSYIYNHFGQRERHLKASRLCRDFILNYCREKSTGYWISKISRDGKTVIEGPYDIYGDMYVILGFTEYYKATGETNLLDIAIETAHGINERIVSPEYQHLQAHKEGYEPGTKILGTWQHFLSALTPLARVTQDYGVEMMARMCVRNIMERHFCQEYGVFFEYLDDSFMPYRPEAGRDLRNISSWHSIQSAWMCMDEALRLGNQKMFMEALEMGRLTFEKCWREGEDGGLIGLDYPEQNIADSSDSPSWGRLDDAMVFALLAIEHTQAPWAIYWFDKIFTHAYKKPELFSRTGLLHHPRRLFCCIEILDRMIERNGKVSDFLAG